MTPRNGQRPTERDWPTSLDAVRRFLDDWYFFITERGRLYVRPQKQHVVKNDVLLYLRHLDYLGEDRLPGVMTFDFSHVALAPSRWMEIADTLQHYATRHALATVVLSGDGRTGGISVLIKPSGLRDASSPRQLVNMSRCETA